MVLKFSRAKLRCCGLKATQSAIRACMVICSGTDSCAKFCEMANHLFCCCPVKAPHCAPKGAKACFCWGLSCCHAVDAGGVGIFCALALDCMSGDTSCATVCAKALAKQAETSHAQPVFRATFVGLNGGLFAMSVMRCVDPETLF